ncbi:protein RMD5 A [Tripterygium wilfordii]|uniref:Protein RMD5 A n=1 Tax=Tripterygium wilfordii TaxID=458696 RepID=A0A7J7CGS9_TRIWF|nr:protein RMD5 homolog [Tripterygium wilfordii]XP_038681887.1 protein RMD5 homolog [Tripterygium wilfordii]KAF5733262.1 protein RMD5 A [Tripterygium wilfordii]
MELSSLKDAFDRAVKKQKLSSSKSQEVIDQVCSEIEQTLAKVHVINDSTPLLDQGSILTELKQKIEAIVPLNQLETFQKESNINLSKYSKLLDKLFNPDIAKGYRNVDSDIHSLNHIIANHLFRQGMFDIGDCFISEVGRPDFIALRSQFWEMYRILEALQVRNIEPALKWVSTNSEKLRQNDSKLELKLHKLKFVDILQSGSRTEALNYAKSYLAPLASLYMDDIQKLMAGILWAGRLDRSPYSEFTSSTHWEKLTEELTKEFCGLLGQSFESPLSVAMAAGFEGLPTLLKLANVMAAKRHEWQEMEQLPVPLELGSKLQFHSIFVCPVSREQCSDENPPMLMPCQHVLSKQSIMKLAKSNSRIFKCPYCPAEVSVEHCGLLYF